MGRERGLREKIPRRFVEESTKLEQIINKEVCGRKIPRRFVKEKLKLE
jgi:hypothetical protein